MDFRRVHSASLDEAKPGSSGSGSTSALPTLWKSLKAKLRRGSERINSPGSTTTNTSPVDLVESPVGTPQASMQSAGVKGAYVRCSSSALDNLPVKNGKGPSQHQRLFPPLATPSSLRKSVSTLPSQPSPTASPSGVNSVASVFSTDSNDGNSGSLTRLPNALSPAQRPMSAMSATQSAVSLRQAQGVSGTPASAEAPPIVTGKLLAMSPGLPAAMKRQAWSLEDYVISKKLYTGSSSAVYRATCRRSGLPVALKVYFLSRVPSNVLHMLKREIQIHVQMVHKHVLRLYGAFMDAEERVVLVQEFAANGDLFGVLQRLGGRMQPDQVADSVMRPFLEALSFLHSRGVCHRDIKPENILFTQSWRLVLADFGVSINLSQERAVTRAGTEGYMAPEVERCPIKNEPDENKDRPHLAYSTAVDVYATGILAYELMVGIPPAVKPLGVKPCSPGVSGFVEAEMGTAALHFPASVPPAARSFISAALSHDPMERPTAAQLLQHPWLLQAAAEARRTAEAGAPAAEAEAEPHSAAASVAAVAHARRAAAVAGEAEASMAARPHASRSAATAELGQQELHALQTALSVE